MTACELRLVFVSECNEKYSSSFNFKGLPGPALLFMKMSEYFKILIFNRAGRGKSPLNSDRIYGRVPGKVLAMSDQDDRRHRSSISISADALGLSEISSPTSDFVRRSR